MDSFRYCLLRYGIPLRVYVDNGKVYISRHFLAALTVVGTLISDLLLAVLDPRIRFQR